MTKIYLFGDKTHSKGSDPYPLCVVEAGNQIQQERGLASFSSVCIEPSTMPKNGLVSKRLLLKEFAQQEMKIKTRF